jgi:hypothetical protein
VVEGLPRALSTTKKTKQKQNKTKKTGCEVGSFRKLGNLLFIFYGFKITRKSSLL